MADLFSAQRSDLDDPAEHVAAVTPADGTDLPVWARALYIGVAGDVKLTSAGGQTETFVGLAAGTTLVVRTARVWATGTTATNIIVLY